MRELDLVASHHLARRPRGVPAMSDHAVGKVRQVEDFSMKHLPQIEVPIEDGLHAGMYYRTAHLEPGTGMTGVFIAVSTLLIVRGDALIYIGEAEPVPVSGYNILKAEAGRKQAFYAASFVDITMIFPTSAQTENEAEAEFTNEVHLLQTRRASK